MTRQDIIGMENIDLDAIHAFAIGVARRAGQYLLDEANKRMGFNKDGSRSDLAESLTAEEKANAVDMVTETDKAVEEMIKSAIQTTYPSHKFIGEETYEKSGEKKYIVDSSPTWIVDPLDGTVNYIHLFPTICVSIGWCIDGIPTIGAIYAPMFKLHAGNQKGDMNGTLFSAIRGKGAWMNYDSDKVRLPFVPRPIPTTAPRGLVFICEWGKDRRDLPDGNLTRKVESFWNMACEQGGRNGKGGMVHGVRSLGSAALDMAWIATGSADIFWEGGCWEWDVCAGICIVEAAGGMVTDCNPSSDSDEIKPVSLGGRRYLAVRPALSTADESGTTAQHRLIREVWKRMRTLDYHR